MPDNLRILVADDDHLVCEEISRAVVEAGFTVIGLARDGKMAVERAISLRPDAILMDIRMPVLDGLEAARRIQEHCPIPVVVLTAYQSSELIDKASESGVGAYLSKPPDAAAIKRAVTIARARFLDLSELRVLSSTDPLTGLHNRRTFEERLSTECSRAARFDHPLGLILWDLDEFKLINDRYGHPAGDIVLLEVAGLALENVREIDSPARIGGDEFATVLPETDLEGSRKLAERLRSSIATHLFRVHHRTLTVTASFGVTARRGPGAAEFEELVGIADDALLRAKREGRNRVCLSPEERQARPEDEGEPGEQQCEFGAPG